MTDDSANPGACHCDDEYLWCEIHVGCDQKCQALEDPQTAKEKDSALDHWKNHGWLNGCAHGA